MVWNAVITWGKGVSPKCYNWSQFCGVHMFSLLGKSNPAMNTFIQYLLFKEGVPLKWLLCYEGRGHPKWLQWFNTNDTNDYNDLINRGERFEEKKISEVSKYIPKSVSRIVRSDIKTHMEAVYGRAWHCNKCIVSNIWLDIFTCPAGQ